MPVRAQLKTGKPMIHEYIVNHQAEFWVLLGFLLLVIEVATGLVSGVFLFVGIGAVITGLLMMFGVLPETWIAGISSTGITSGLSLALLWKPLKKLQDSKTPGKDNSSDLVGYEFELATGIDQQTDSSVSYSGVNWKVELDSSSQQASINQGERVVVSSVEVGVFKVLPKT
jgi:inner membrane protein